MRMQDGPELLFRDLRDELHVAKRVIVTQVAIESADIGNELFPLFLGQSLHLRKCTSLKLVEILVRKISLEDAPEWGSLVRELV